MAGSLDSVNSRFRMESAYDCSGFSHEVQVICAALKKYGMLVADNSANWFISGARTRAGTTMPGAI